MYIAAMKTLIFALIAVFGLSSCKSPTPASTPAPELADPRMPCSVDAARKEARSKELQELVKADQAIRENFQSMTDEQSKQAARDDLSRRKRVAEIFAEGCFSKAEDYAAAALVFQHGDHPDHFYQTYVWSRRAVELGDKSQKSMMALSIDRYLVNVGEKQLFGSQASKPDEKSCWCIHQVEPSFPEKLRLEYVHKTVKQQLEWANTLNEPGKCKPQFCKVELKKPRKGLMPGVW